MTGALIEHLDPTPAIVLGPWYQVLAHNESWQRIAEPIGLLDGDPPNLARFTFLDARARYLYPAWDAVADEQVATLREAAIPWREDDRMGALLDELMPVEGFATRWRLHDEVAPTGHEDGRGPVALALVETVAQDEGRQALRRL